MHSPKALRGAARHGLGGLPTVMSSGSTNGGKHTSALSLQTTDSICLRGICIRQTIQAVVCYSIDLLDVGGRESTQRSSVAPNQIARNPTTCTQVGVVRRRSNIQAAACETGHLVARAVGRDCCDWPSMRPRLRLKVFPLARALAIAGDANRPNSVTRSRQCAEQRFGVARDQGRSVILGEPRYL